MARSVIRIHHCYADGIALVRVMLSMTDAGARRARRHAISRRRAHKARIEDDESLALLGPLADVVETARKVGTVLVEKGAQAWSDPAQAVRLAEKAAGSPQRSRGSR